MSELEAHHGSHGHGAHGHDPHAAADPLGPRIGVMVGLLGILLAVVTISSHRAHTAAVVHRTEANDAWAYYQAKKIREHTSEVAAELTETLGTDAAKVEHALQHFSAMGAKYAKDAEQIKADAEARDLKTVEEEHRALAFDLGEGFLELGLVLTSLYFLGRDRGFPLAGGLAAAIGVGLGLIGHLGGGALLGLAKLFGE